MKLALLYGDSLFPTVHAVSVIKQAKIAAVLSAHSYGFAHCGVCGRDLPQPEGINSNDFSPDLLHSWHSSL